MTGGQFREVDFDLLADYVGGALDGTADEAEVARLVDEDPAWTEAYAALAVGVDAVRVNLAGWAAEPVPMPAKVTYRLTSVLTRPGGADPESAPTSSAESAESAEPADQPPGVRADVPDSGPGPSSPAQPGGPTHPAGRPRRQLSAVPVQAGRITSTDSSGPGRRRRWTRRMAGPILVATVVAGFAGFAISRLIDAGGGAIGGAADQAATGTALNSAGDVAAPTEAPGSGPPRTVLEPSAERVLATGNDYTPSSLPGTVAALAKRAVPVTPSTPVSPAAPPRRESGPGSTPQVMTGTRPANGPAGAGADLERLADRSVLARCLDAVAAAHAQGPVVVDLVDYAAFEGRAALVVVFIDRSGSRWAWVTGPNCGSSSSGADVAYQTRVG